MSDPTPVRAGEDAGREEHPTNDTLQRIGAFDRPCKIGKHQATNWVHLRAMLVALDAAGLREAADTLIWQVWHRVNSEARYHEFYRFGLDERLAFQAEASALRERVARLEEALRPFCFGDPTLEQILFGGMPDSEACNLTVRLRDTRRARAALTEGAPTDV